MKAANVTLEDALEEEVEEGVQNSGPCIERDMNR